MKLHLEIHLCTYIYIYIYDDDERIVATQKQISQQRTIIQIGLHLRLLHGQLERQICQEVCRQLPRPRQGSVLVHTAH